MTNIGIIILVLVSFVILALETEPSISDVGRQWIMWFNYAVLGIFAVEYILRIWSEGEDPRFKGLLGRVRYMFQPFALLDLVAFLPELIFVLFFAASGNAEMLMWLKILRLARLAKIARFMPAFGVLWDTLKRSGGQLLTTLALALTLVYLSALVLYVIEGVGQGRAEFASIPRAIWWATATLTTVGYGDAYPVTALGKIAAGIIAVAGIGVVALPAGIFASAFADELREREREKQKLADQTASDSDA